MELLRSWGLEDEIRAGGMPEVEWLGLVTETLASADRGQTVTLGLPTKEQAAVLSPTAPLCAPQDHTEMVLLGYARSLGADVQFGGEVLRVDVADDGAEALVRDGDRVRVVSARYVIGADGARSVVRSALGIEMDGPGAVDTVSVTAAFRAPLWDVVGEPRYGLYPIVHPELSSVFVPSGRGDNWVFGVAADLMARPDEAEMTRLIRIAAGVPDLEPRIHRITTFNFAAEIADRFAARSAFSIGDAARSCTAAGMNTAIADGHDLGWKLGWVLNAAGPTRTSSIPTRRSGAQWRHNLERSVDEGGSPRPDRRVPRRPRRTDRAPLGEHRERADVDARPDRRRADADLGAAGLRTTSEGIGLGGRIGAGDRSQGPGGDGPSAGDRTRPLATGQAERRPRAASH